MPARRAARIALAALLVGTALAVTGIVVSARRADSWSVALQNVVNVGFLLQISAFLFSAYQFWATRHERRAADAAAAIQARKDSIYQAWQVINSAQGKGGSGGRPDALADLVRNGISLAGVDLDGAWLEQVDLRGASLAMASLQNTNLRGAQLRGATLDGANFRGATLVAA
jgi:hypothetical protein